jgi:hypothetical protein
MFAQFTSGKRSTTSRSIRVAPCTAHSSGRPSCAALQVPWLGSVAPVRSPTVTAGRDVPSDSTGWRRKRQCQCRTQSAERLIFPLLAALAAASCQDIHRARADELSSREPAALHLEVVRALAADKLLMGHIGAVVTDERGMVYALEAAPPNHTIAVFAPDGRRVKELGRRGNGPGEFQEVVHSLVWLGDTLLVFDWKQLRLTGFDVRRGEILVLPWPPGAVSPTRLHVGNGIVYGTVLDGQHPAQFRFARIDVKRASVSEMAWLRDTVPGQRVVRCRGGLARYDLDVPFHDPTLLVGVARDGRLIRGDLLAYRLRWIDPESGRVTHTAEREVTRRALQQRDILETREGAWLETFEEEAGGKLLDDRHPEQLCSFASLLPQTVPPLRSLTTDSDGRVWVETAPVLPTDTMSSGLDVFDAAGKWIATGPMPHYDHRVDPYVRGDSLFVVRRDKDGAQELVVFLARFGR